jgi:hypothetical protein
MIYSAVSLKNKTQHFLADEGLHTTVGLLPACPLLASPINKMDLLWGSAGKLFKFDGRQQAVER